MPRLSESVPSPFLVNGAPPPHSCKECGGVHGNPIFQVENRVFGTECGNRTSYISGTQSVASRSKATTRGKSAKNPRHVITSSSRHSLNLIYSNPSAPAIFADDTRSERRGFMLEQEFPEVKVLRGNCCANAAACFCNRKLKSAD